MMLTPEILPHCNRWAATSPTGRPTSRHCAVHPRAATTWRAASGIVTHSTDRTSSPRLLIQFGAGSVRLIPWCIPICRGADNISAWRTCPRQARFLLSIRELDLACPGVCSERQCRADNRELYVQRQYRCALQFCDECLRRLKGESLTGSVIDSRLMIGRYWSSGSAIGTGACYRSLTARSIGRFLGDAHN